MTPSRTNTSLLRPADDTGGGLLMFVVFTVAVLSSTGAVVLIALVGEWWMLGFGFAVHVIVTAAVVLTIAHVMAPMIAEPRESLRRGRRVGGAPRPGLASPFSK